MDAITIFSYKPSRFSFAIAGMGFVGAFVLCRYFLMRNAVFGMGTLG
jgi:hypothetical protein